MARGLGLERDPLDCFYRAELHRLQGHLRLLDAAHRGGAEDSFRKALEVARAQGAATLELRAATSLGRLLHGRGDGAEARALLAGIYRQFTEGFKTLDLVEARQLLAELGEG